MFFELSSIWIVVLNLVTIPVIHLGISWLFMKMPRRWFALQSFWFRERPFERNGKFYQSVFRIRQWKGLLPDAAPWFDGFAKKDLRSVDPVFLEKFRGETCRGEGAHIVQAVGLLVTLVWNPGIAAIVIVLYAVLSNLPCILLQRFTRARLSSVLQQMRGAAL